jgi:hypothetical protein
MTDPSKLMPGPELDAMVAEAIGWKFDRLCADDSRDVVLCIEGAGIDHECTHLSRGGTWETCKCKLADACPRYSIDPAANADVERWLVEHVPAEQDVIARNRLPTWRYVCPYYEVRYTPNGDTEWTAEYGWEDEEGERHCLCDANALTAETNSDPIAARMLAVCRFAVRVAGELKRLEEKP